MNAWIEAISSADADDVKDVRDVRATRPVVQSPIHSHQDPVAEVADLANLHPPAADVRRDLIEPPLNRVPPAPPPRVRKLRGVLEHDVRARESLEDLGSVLVPGVVEAADESDSVRAHISRARSCAGTGSVC
jgi:hypothetical protein